jgi:hypothetical protein
MGATVANSNADQRAAPGETVRVICDMATFDEAGVSGKAPL